MKFLKKLFNRKKNNVTCLNCGSIMSDNYNYCPFCGKNPSVYDKKMNDKLEPDNGQQRNEQEQGVTLAEQFDKLMDKNEEILDGNIRLKSPSDSGNEMPIDLFEIYDKSSLKNEKAIGVNDDFIKAFDSYDDNSKHDDSGITKQEDFKLSECDKEIVKKIIEYLYDEIKYDYVTLNKVLGRIYALNEDIIKKYNINTENIKSFIKTNFNYFVSDTFVGKYKIENDRDIIINHFIGHDEVCKQDLLNFFDEIGYKNTQAYNKYYTLLMKNDYIMISNERLIKRQLFIIDNENITKIFKVIDFALNNVNEIDINNNKKIYMLMPNINYEWNKYILEDIINIYSNDRYVIFKENDNEYLRRKNYE